MPWAVAAAVVGGGIAANASNKASKTQAKSANDATAAQERMFDRQVELQRPTLEAGEGSVNLLGQLLGLPGYENRGTGRVTGANLLSTENGAPAANKDLYANNAAYRASWDRQLNDHRNRFGGGYTGLSDAGAIEESLRQDLANEYANEAANPQAPNAQYGTLLKKFSMDDFEQDPGYEFRLNEGRKTLEGSAAARGGLFSGAAGKALTRYGQDYGSNEYGKAFDRFNVQNTNIFNRLASVSGLGQASANQTGAAAQNFGNQMGNNIIGAGNAMAAGQVGSANAWSNAIGQGYNAYQNNELMKRLQAPTSGGWGSSGGFGTGTQYGNQDYGQYI